ncbi:MAG: ParB N-terminal domain-containing protein [Paracoccaceae bacterium]|nr:ParB N-terminal domain-containing protein [Paracoccaceae bacterium]
MSKRRIFDIDFPDGDAADAAPAGSRRGPMASAISENADALAERQATESRIREENDRLAHELVRLRKAGLITEEVPVASILTDKLTRDRTDRRDPELDELKASIRDVGLSNPIRVEVQESGYQLVQGYRRLNAYRELFAETGDDRFARIPAGLIAHGEALEALYRKMVDENLVRRDISFAEMADLARKYAADPETRAETVAQAIALLYASAGRQKRNYIGHFASLLDRIGDSLTFPEAIPRSLGLQLERRMAADARLARRVSDALMAFPIASAAKEIELLRGFAVPAGTATGADTARTGRPTAKTTLRFEGPGGMVRCTASDGKLEIRAEKDFGSLDRHDLEAALDAFFQALDN